ncbi:hypothetical protein BIU97_10480 [Curtobacterium sp. MCBA15_009]|uniref:hypothetical protein n=1 Tax=Curtobacterium sp. MCBA15_009 TaxID=1898737 RepID=UPI0008DE122B|nr:hypothetical protein [Curtobacterium sp. MCBA15_009]OII10545.1 hypothetical protein BIU97_10480 [Curtobacterium sp. MCBA15_009]
MFTTPLSNARLQLDITLEALGKLRASLALANEMSTREAISEEIRWHEAREVKDRFDLWRLREQCAHVWVPAGLEPDDERVCARCGLRWADPASS